MLPWFLQIGLESISLSLQEKKRKIHFPDSTDDDHLGFPIGMILATLVYKLSRYFLPSFESVGLSIQKKRKIYFQDGGHGGHLGNPIVTILAIFDSRYFLPSFESVCLSVQEKKRKIYFQDGVHGGHLGPRIGTILAILDLQVFRILSI